MKYDEFKAADFIIEVTEATGSNGQFTGKGLALVPYLGFAKFKVEFDDITINTDRRMVAGEVRFVYDVATGMVIGLGASGTQAKEIVATDYLKDQYSKIITTTQEVKRVEVKDSTVTITLADGSTQKVTASKKGDTVAIITPSKTTAYVADTNSGMVYTSPLPSKSEASNSAAVASASQTKQYGSSVTITPSKTQQFGFDVVGNGTDKPKNYFLTNKSAQSVAWKSLKAGANDYVDVTATGASIDSLRYLRESGMATPSTGMPKGRQLLLTGSADGEEELLTIALSTTKMGKDSTIKQTLTELGALGLVSYDPLVREVIIVPVNAAQAPSSSSAIQTTLNTIFAPAVVSWKVTMASPITVTGITPEGFSTTNLSLASRYTTDMKTVIKAYKATNNISSSTLVLFFVTATNADKLGYMPLTGNYGFIFKLGSNIELLAHELSHGAFNLKHTFSDISFWRESGAAPVFKEKSTHNLMDYAGGSELWKYQWDLIHDPEIVVMGSLDEDEGASQISSDPVCTQKFFEKFRWAFINKKALYYEKDGYPYFGHYSKEIRLLDGKTYDDIHVLVKEDIGFVPFVITPQINYSRADYSYGKVLYFYSGNKHEDFNKYLFPTADEYNQQMTALVSKISSATIREDILDLLSIMPDEEYCRLDITTRIKCLNKISEGFITADYTGCVDNEELVINLVNGINQPSDQIKLLESLENTGNLMILMKGLNGTEWN